jgi:predicted TIM-barrel fold metal-dependent hydrolase
MQNNLRVNFPPDPNPRKPRITVPPGSWDTHFHVFAPHLFPYAETRRYTPPAAPVEHFLSVSAALGIDRAVIVQPSVHGADTRVTVDAIAKSDGRLVGVIRADPSLSASDIKRLHAAGVRGVRFAAVDALGETFTAEEFTSMVALVEPHGWVVAMHIEPASLMRHIDMISRVQLPLIIDASARLDPLLGTDQPAFPVLLDLLSQPNVVLKLTGANRLTAKGVAFESIIAMNRPLIERARKRVIWGSDWPHADVFEANKMPNDADLIDMLLAFAPDPEFQREILVETPTRLFAF